MKRETVKKHIEASNMSGHTKAKIIDYISNLEIHRDLLKSNELNQWDKDIKIKEQQAEIERLKGELKEALSPKCAKGVN
jgi:hypothetical protein